MNVNAPHPGLLRQDAVWAAGTCCGLLQLLGYGQQQVNFLAMLPGIAHCGPRAGSQHFIRLMGCCDQDVCGINNVVITLDVRFGRQANVALAECSTLGVDGRMDDYLNP